MSSELNPAAGHDLPGFITSPGETDVLMVITAVFLVLAVLAVGILFLRLHTLPERLAHRTQKLQFEIVAVLGLLALFTHMHIFWVAGLLLAVVDLPDFGTPLRRMAGSLEKMAGARTGEATAESPSSVDSNVADLPDDQVVSGSRLPPKTEGPASAASSTKELTHV